MQSRKASIAALTGSGLVSGDMWPPCAISTSVRWAASRTSGRRRATTASGCPWRASAGSEPRTCAGAESLGVAVGFADPASTLRMPSRIGALRGSGICARGLLAHPIIEEDASRRISIAAASASPWRPANAERSRHIRAAPPIPTDESRTAIRIQPGEAVAARQRRLQRDPPP